MKEIIRNSRYLLISAGIVIADQIVKLLAAQNLAGRGRVSFIPGFMNLLYAENTGAAFSIFRDQRVLLSVISLLLAGVICFLILTGKFKTRGELITLSMVLGGAVGNLIDRVFNGYVVDMFEFAFISFPIFNVADIFVTCGGAAFLISFIYADYKAGRLRKEADSDEA